MVRSPHLHLAAVFAALLSTIQPSHATVVDYNPDFEGDQADPEEDTEGAPPPGEADSLEEPLMESLVSSQFPDDPLGGLDPLEMVQDMTVYLTEISFATDSFSAENEDGHYTNVMGEFCVYNRTANREDPSNYPKATYIMTDAEHCATHSYLLDLQEVMDAVESYHEDPDTVVETLNLQGLVVHEGYAGAAVLSNALATLEDTLVISEHPALGDALSACDVISNRFLVTDCDPAQQQQLIRDVVTLLSRSSDPNLTSMYLKLHSSSAAYLHNILALYPSSQWLYVYRNPEVALDKAMEIHRNTCIKAKRNPSAALKAKAEEYEVDLEELSQAEVCALHLATLTDQAAREHDASHTGMLVNYDHDILANEDNVLNVLLPFLGLDEDTLPGVKAALLETIGQRTNTRMVREPEDGADADGVLWEADTERRRLARREISEEIVAASRKFMTGSRDFVERLRA